MARSGLPQDGQPQDGLLAVAVPRPAASPAVLSEAWRVRLTVYEFSSATAGSRPGTTIVFSNGNALPLLANMTGLVHSDLELARRESPGVPDAELVVALAQRAVADLGMAPPVSAVLMASMRGVSRVEEADMPWAGCLMADDGELVIRLRASDVPGRKRFSAFHEIMHTFMPGFAVVPQYRCDPQFPGDGQEPSSKPAVEELCDLGAAEMLLPRAEFLADMAGSAPTISLASKLAVRYAASLEASARRVVDLHHRPAMLIVLEVAPKPSAPRAEPRLRVQLVHANGGWPFIPRHKSVPQGSPLASPLAGEPVNSTCTLEGIADRPLQDVHVSAVFAPYTDRTSVEHARVVAMISRPGREGRGHGG